MCLGITEALIFFFMNTLEIINTLEVLKQNLEAQQLIDRINDKIEELFSCEAMQHTCIESLVIEVNEWIPTAREHRVYADIQALFNHYFLTYSSHGNI